MVDNNLGNNKEPKKRLVLELFSKHWLPGPDISMWPDSICSSLVADHSREHNTDQPRTDMIQQNRNKSVMDEEDEYINVVDSDEEDEGLGDSLHGDSSCDDSGEFSLLLIQKHKLFAFCLLKKYSISFQTQTSPRMYQSRYIYECDCDGLTSEYTNPDVGLN